MSAPIHSVSDWKSSRFDMIIDVRSPEEFQIDHIPSAVNMPVLTDTQRAEVGKIYKQMQQKIRSYLFLSILALQA